MATSSRAFEKWRQQFLEGFPEFDVEDSVDDGVQKAVHIAEPHEEGEEDRVDVARTALEVVTDAHGVDDVDSEKWHPTEQEDSWDVGVVGGGFKFFSLWCVVGRVGVFLWVGLAC